MLRPIRRCFEISIVLPWLVLEIDLMREMEKNKGVTKTSVTMLPVQAGGITSGYDLRKGQGTIPVLIQDREDRMKFLVIAAALVISTSAFAKKEVEAEVEVEVPVMAVQE